MQRVHIAPDEYGEGGGTGFLCTYGHLHPLGIGALVCGLLHPHTWVTVWAIATMLVPNIAVLGLLVWADLPAVMHVVIWLGLLTFCGRRFAWLFERV